MKKIMITILSILFITLNLYSTSLKVRNVAGKAQYREIKKSKWERVRVGSMINDQCRVRVGKGSTVVLQAENGTLITLKDQTIFDVSQLISDGVKEVSRFRLYYGKFKAVVNKLKNDDSKWEVMTPTAVAGVRGTVLGIHVDNRVENEIAVFKGQVEVRNNRGIGKPVMVETQQIVAVKHDKEPSAPSLLPNLEKTFEMWVKNRKPSKKGLGLPGADFDMPDWLTPYKKNNK
jgi:hypothetical protein